MYISEKKTWNKSYLWER